MSLVSYEDIVDIYVAVFDSIRQASPPGRYEEFLNEFPRDPVAIARGIEDAFGLKISVKIVDFYLHAEDIPDERRDLFSFYQYFEDGHIVVWVNSNVMEVGRPLLSPESIRFAFAKEVFIAALRAVFTSDESKQGAYPETADFISLAQANISWIVEKPSIYDFEDGIRSPSVEIENAAEVLAIMSLTDVRHLSLYRKRFLSGPSGMSTYDPGRHAELFGVKVRFLYVLLSTPFAETLFSRIEDAVAGSSDRYFCIDPEEPWDNEGNEESKEAKGKE